VDSHTPELVEIKLEITTVTSTVAVETFPCERNEFAIPEHKQTGDLVFARAGRVATIFCVPHDHSLT
jgi:hypothetical protein